MKTKTIPASTRYPAYAEYKYASDNFTRMASAILANGEQTITYGLGPQWSQNHRNWKPCVHKRINTVYGQQGHWDVGFDSRWANQWGWNVHTTFGFTGDAALPELRNLYPQCFSDIMGQLDLNSSDAVLLYSGILQAVPLLGGAFKFVSVFNRAAKKLSKSFKKKPFTTVVRSLIQGDFIDRFVVKPTIDDARKFLDAHNFVMRTMETLHNRNKPEPLRWTAKKQDVTVTDLGRDVMHLPLATSDLQPNSPEITARVTKRVGCESQLFLLANVTYPADTVDPVKLWAARVGLTRPLDSVWDLVPFSFVVDYVTRAGDMISGLSDEMSSQEGLRGTITRIHSCWGTTKCYSRTTWDDMSAELPWYNARWNKLLWNMWAPGIVHRESSIFERSSLNPWGLLTAPESELVHWGMSQTRYRTLLELFLQAKLR